MLNISVCDDDIRVLEQIEELINEYCIENNIKATISSYMSGEEFLSKAILKRVDLLFLDIKMDKINGLDVAGELRKVNDHAELIFVTSYDEYMREVFRYSVAGYISKPIVKKEFDEILDRIQENSIKRGSRFFYKTGRGEGNILKKDILYLASDNREVLIYTKNGKYDSYLGKLEDAKDRLFEFNFVQVSKSFIINFDKISKISRQNVVLIDKANIEISRAYKLDVMHAYMRYRDKKGV